MLLLATSPSWHCRPAGFGTGPRQRSQSSRCALSSRHSCSWSEGKILEVRIFIWIAKKFTEEHRQNFDYLNECTSGRPSLYGVEVEVLRIGDSLPPLRFHKP